MTTADQAEEDYWRDVYAHDRAAPAPLTPISSTTADPAPRRVIRDRLLSRADLANLPTPAPLIDRTLDLRSVAVLAGRWGTCKSFAAQDWAACVATGRPWQGRQVVQGTVLYVAAEGAYGLDQRLAAWEFTYHHDIDPQALAVLPEPINLLDSGAVNELADAARGRHLVIIDTLARCMPGGDENSARDMGLAVDALYRIQRATEGGTVLAVHHTGKDGPLADRVNLHLVEALHSAVLMSALGVDTTSSEQQLMSAFVSGHELTGASKSELRATAAMAPASFARALQGLIRKGFLINTGTDTRPFYKKAETD